MTGIYLGTLAAKVFRLGKCMSFFFLHYDLTHSHSEIARHHCFVVVSGVTVLVYFSLMC